MTDMKKQIEVHVNGLNALGVKELNEYYKNNIEKGYFSSFTLGDKLVKGKKRFKNVKQFIKEGLDNYLGNFDCTQSILNEDGTESTFYGPCFSLQIKHFDHEIFEVEVIETFTKIKL